MNEIREIDSLMIDINGKIEYNKMMAKVHQNYKDLGRKAREKENE
jgi:hypothetical protein